MLLIVAISRDFCNSRSRRNEFSSQSQTILCLSVQSARSNDPNSFANFDRFDSRDGRVGMNLVSLGEG